ncbi:MAG: class I SAM-dependent methyltransferase [Aestuariivita sp.]|nr:class I SAM-dependent methyltransferase [Aestuariivita sp.]MCY4346078.1 class I SAM-dependent methyltransferase [Aestuariivita sp.]
MLDSYCHLKEGLLGGQKTETSDPTTLEVYAKKINDYVDIARSQAEQDPLINEFIATCPPNGRVLDFGCGPGHYAEMMAVAGLRVDAIDACAEMVRYAKRVSNVATRQATFDDLDTTDLYDGIWVNFSLLHAPRSAFPTHLSAIARALKQGGVLFVSLKRDYGSARDLLGRYYTYFQLSEIECFLGDAGLSPSRHWSGSGFGLSGEHAEWLMVEAYA